MKRRRRRISDFKPDITRRIGLAWYEPQDYARMLEIMNYPGGMSRSYERWREVAENDERSWKRRRGGFMPIRVVINPDKFLAWCSARSKEPNIYTVGSFVQEAIGMRV
jgi:hypothetical protein